MKVSNNSAQNNSNSDDFIKNNPSQELQHIKKLVVTASRSKSRQKKKEKKFDREKGVRVKARFGDS